MSRKIAAVALFLLAVALGGTVVAAPVEPGGQTVGLAQLVETPHGTCTSAAPLVSTAEIDLTAGAELAPTACQLVVNCCRGGNANCCAVVSSACR